MRSRRAAERWSRTARSYRCATELPLPGFAIAGGLPDELFFHDTVLLLPGVLIRSAPSMFTVLLLPVTDSSFADTIVIVFLFPITAIRPHAPVNVYVPSLPMIVASG